MGSKDTWRSEMKSRSKDVGEKGAFWVEKKKVGRPAGSKKKPPETWDELIDDYTLGAGNEKSTDI